MSYHLPGPSCLISWLHHESAVSGVPCISSGELISGCDPPGRYPPSRIPGRLSNWEPAHNLVEDAISGAKVAPCLLALAVACLPHFLWWGDGPFYTRLALLWYSLNLLFCEQTRLCLRLQLFVGKFSLSLFSLSLAIPQFGLLSHVTSLRLSSRHSVPILTLSIQPIPPYSCPTLCWWPRASGLLLHWEWCLGADSVFFCLFCFVCLFVLFCFSPPG